QNAVAEALANNPSIRAALRKWSAARARVPQAKAWDDPRVSYDNVAGRFVELPANAMPDQTLTLEQLLPVAGKNLSRARIAAAEALVAYEEMRRRQLDVSSNVRVAWFGLVNADRQLEINSQDAASLGQITHAARSGYQAGAGTATGALQIEIEASKLEEQRLNLERVRSEAQTRLNVLMNRPPSEAISVASAEAPMPDFSEAALASRLLAARPEIRMAAHRVEAERARVQLAKREWIPDPAVSVNAQRYNDAAQTVSQVGAGISFSIPWVNPGKYREGVREAQENLAAAEADLQREKAESLGRLHDQLKRIETAHHHYGLYGGAIRNEARQAFDAAQLGYSAGKATFAEWLTALRMLREVDAAEAEMLADYQAAVAELGALIGEEPSPPAAAAKKHPHHR
ncbi:MAG: TolC family protein, partial [Terrimicrobiaceae bacterium]|nr:TolC family protein [Terrimicrobiaceae bacterium]